METSDAATISTRRVVQQRRRRRARSGGSPARKRRRKDGCSDSYSATVETGRSATSWSHRDDDAVESVPTDDADDVFRRRPTTAAARRVFPRRHWLNSVFPLLVESIATAIPSERLLPVCARRRAAYSFSSVGVGANRTILVLTLLTPLLFSCLFCFCNT